MLLTLHAASLDTQTLLTWILWLTRKFSTVSVLYIVICHWTLWCWLTCSSPMTCTQREDCVPVTYVPLSWCTHDLWSWTVNIWLCNFCSVCSLFTPGLRSDIAWLDFFYCDDSDYCLRQCFNYPSSSVHCNNNQVVFLNCSMLTQ